MRQATIAIIISFLWVGVFSGSVYGEVREKAVDIPPVLKKIQKTESKELAGWRSKHETTEKIFELIEERYFYAVDLERCYDDMLKSLTDLSLGAYEKNEKGENVYKEFVCLDKYSGVYTPSEALKRQEVYEGHYKGTGARLIGKDGKVIVFDVHPGSPAEKMLQIGDELLGHREEEKGITTPFLGLKHASEYLREAPGDAVYLTVLRSGKRIELPALIRQEIKVRSVVAKEIQRNIGYIRVSKFIDETGDDFVSALHNFGINGISKIAVDLRRNSGGRTGAVLKMLFQFSKDPSDIMLTMRYREGESVYTVGCHASENGSTGFLNQTGVKRLCGTFDDPVDGGKMTPGRFSHFKVVILIDEESASSSEIFAGTMQDWGRTNGGQFFVVGTPSFGKCTGQSSYPLGDGSWLRLTISEYQVGNAKYSPCGKGVIPDYVVEKAENVSEQGNVDQTLAKAIEVLMK